MNYVTNVIDVVLNSNVTLEIVAIVALFVYVKYLKNKVPSNYWDLVTRYKPYAVDAVKWAEKAIPDDTPNKAAAKADAAMKYALSTIKTMENLKDVPDDLGELLRSIITVVHGEMDSRDTLPFPQGSPVVSSDMPQPELLDEMDPVVTPSETVSSS